MTTSVSNRHSRGGGINMSCTIIEVIEDSKEASTIELIEDSKTVRKLLL